MNVNKVLIYLFIFYFVIEVLGRPWSLFESLFMHDSNSSGIFLNISFTPVHELYDDSVLTP